MLRKPRTQLRGRPPWTLADFERFIEPPIPFLNPDYAIPTPLYHYTSGPAYVSILKCRYLRATNFSYLNDPSEVLYGTKLVRESLKHRQHRRTGKVAAFLGRLAEAFETIAASEVYVCSFSGLRDDLSQWRAYGNSMTERIAIGFDPNVLDEEARAHPAAALERVNYEREKQIEQIEYILDKTIEAVSDLKPSDGTPTFVSAAARRLSRLLPTLKDGAYRNEKEWRVVLWENGSIASVEIDTSRGVMRPFLRFALPVPLPVDEVLVLAPNRSGSSMKAAKIVLAQAGLLTLEPQPSDVPFAD